VTTLENCQALDERDPLRPLRDLFVLPPGVIYLDGNSLGALPRTAASRVSEIVTEQWGQGLIRSWNDAGWVTLPQRVGDKIARLIGARPGEVVATDSTSVNLYKVLSAALSIAAADHPSRRQVVSETTNFPTDLYLMQALCRERGYELMLVDGEEVAAAITAATAIVSLTHVNYRTGAMHDMSAVTTTAHAAGALAIWDLAHSAGAVPLGLHAAEADFAVGCGYKYLNGGPGAPAFVWVHPRHVDRFSQPLAGWWGHTSPFEFSPDYRPAAGIARYLCGTPPIISLAALECGVDTLLAAEPLGGLAAIRSKSLALTDLFMRLVEERCAGHGLRMVSPRDPARRGSQVCLTHDDPDAPGHSGGHAIVQALITRGVIGDFRAGDGGAQPDILRFGFTPLYLTFTDVWHAVERLRQILDGDAWRGDQFRYRRSVT
jgi:kynureninase